MLSEWSGKISRPRNERNIKLYYAKLVIYAHHLGIS